jgi:hypothetical protein
MDRARIGEADSVIAIAQTMSIKSGHFPPGDRRS